MPATVIHLGPLLPVTAAYADVNARSLTGTYKFRSGDVDLQFSLKKLGGGVVAGRFAEVTGSLVLDGKRPQRSKIEMNVRLASVETGSARMTGFLKSGVMFNVKKYPTARFVSTRVDVSGDTQAKVVGLLTLKGQTHPVTMTVDLLSGGRKKVRLKADGSFNRSKYGMNLGQPIYANRVRLGINLTGKR
ncbi:MAG: YceI family protein [Stappiaceae bacterium]